MSDTPRTDAIPRNGPFHHYRAEDVLDCARTLERELAEAKAELETAKEATTAAMETCAKITQLRIAAEARCATK